MSTEEDDEQADSAATATATGTSHRRRIAPVIVRPARAIDHHPLDPRRGPAVRSALGRKEKGPVNKGGLVGEVSKRTGLNKADVARVVDASIDTIREAVAKGDRVALVGFGTFEQRKRGQRLARNPRKPEVEITVPARVVPSFTPGQAFTEAVAEKKRRSLRKTTAKGTRR